MSRETDLEARWPEVPWREPIHIERVDGLQGYACRFCIAFKGMKAADIGKLPKHAHLVRKHIQVEHGLS